MDIRVGDILTLKKQHPCGSRDWQVLRIGADFKLKCLGCGREVMDTRQKFEKMIRAIERPEVESAYREELSSAFDVDGKFQVTAISAPDLDSMDTRERNRISYRLQIYLEDISHNAHFIYYNGCFLLILNAVDAQAERAIIDGFLTRAKRRMAEQKIYVGEGSPVTDISNLHLSYKRANTF